MRISLIGAGVIGTAHASRLVKFSEVDELLVADVREGSAEQLAGKLPKTSAVSLDDAFSKDVDGVVVTSHTASHAELIHRAIESDIPVFSEKPIALDMVSTRSVVEHAKRNPSLPVMIGFQRRFDAGYIAARKAYQNGELGFVHTLHATTYDEFPPPPAFIPTSGGILKDCSIHDFDIITWVTGKKAVRVFTTGSNMGDKYIAEGADVDSCSSLVVYDNGMAAQIGATRYNGAGHDVRLELFGSKSGRFVGLDERTPLISAEFGKPNWAKNTYHVYHERFNNAYIAELKHFLAVISGKELNKAATPQEAFEALCVAEACGISMRENRLVNVEEVINK